MNDAYEGERSTDVRINENNFSWMKNKLNLKMSNDEYKWMLMAAIAGTYLKIKLYTGWWAWGEE